MRTRPVQIILLLVLSSLATRSLSGQCGGLSAQSSADDLSIYLRNQLDVAAQRWDRECIAFALQQLEYKRSTNSIPLLIAYLDFERPSSEAEKQGFMFHGPPAFIGGKYPATGALQKLGKAAVPALVSAIETRESATARRNATYIIMQIFRTEPENGILLLRQKAKNSSGQASANLKDATEAAVQWCGEKYRVECEQAAHDENR